MGSLEGDTNWLNEAQRTERLTDGITRLITAGLVLVGIVIVIW